MAILRIIPRCLHKNSCTNGLCSCSQDSWLVSLIFVCTGLFWSCTIRKLFSEGKVRDGSGWELWPFSLKWLIYFSGDLTWLTLIFISPGHWTSFTKGNPQPLFTPGGQSYEICLIRVLNHEESGNPDRTIIEQGHLKVTIWGTFSFSWSF